MIPTLTDMKASMVLFWKVNKMLFVAIVCSESALFFIHAACACVYSLLEHLFV